MTFPMFCALHLIYGAVMAYSARARMMDDGEVLGWPLVATLAPVALVSIPLGAVLCRYAGAWFFQGIPIEDFAVEFERFQFGIILLVAVSATICTLAGKFFTIAFISRNIARYGLVPVVVGSVVVLLSVGLGFSHVIHPTQTSTLLSHPAGICSLGILLCLVAAMLFVRARLSAPLRA